MKLFVDKSDTIDVKIYYTEKDNTVLALTASEYDGLSAKLLDEKGINEWKGDTIVFRYPSYSDSVKMSSNSVSLSDEGGISINAQGINFSRIITLIVSWTFKDEEGNDIEPTIDNISSLNPTIGQAIGRGLEEVLDIDINMK